MQVAIRYSILQGTVRAVRDLLMKAWGKSRIINATATIGGYLLNSTGVCVNKDSL